jgi:SET domain
MATNPFLETLAYVVIDAEDPRFEIRELQPEGHRALFSRKNFQIGEAIHPFGASQTLTQPDRYTVQTAAADRHIILDPEFLLYINHHCRPNCFFDLRTMQLRAVAPIRQGDEFTFFYPSTEWAMSEAFQCHCGSTHCLGRVQGAAYLDEEKLSNYDLSDHIKDLVWLRKLEQRKHK